MSEETAADRGKRMLHESGYAKGGEISENAEDTAIAKRVVRKAIRQHESAEHGGEHKALRLKRGGTVEGEAAESRPDRRARGGAMSHHGKSKGKPAVNIKIAAGGSGQPNPEGEQMAAKAGLAKGVQLGAQMAAAKMGGGAPPGPPPGPGPAGPPPGAPPPGMMNSGGRVKRAKGGSVPADDEKRPKGEDYEEDGRHRDQDDPSPDNGDGRQRGGSVGRKAGGRAC